MQLGIFADPLQINATTYRYNSLVPDLSSHRPLLICYCMITVFNTSKVNRQPQRWDLMLTLS